MRHWLLVQSYHVVVLIAMIAACSVVFAWNSYGLIMVAMANFDFLTRWGLMAVMEGGLWQSLELALKSLVALFSYLGFKGIEHELIHRWRGLEGPPGEGH